jgi:hypothetical protein
MSDTKVVPTVKTAFALLLERCGLEREYAPLVLYATPRITRQQVVEWSDGVSQPPADVMRALRVLYTFIEKDALAYLEKLDQLERDSETADRVTIRLSHTVTEANDAGYPTPGVHAAAVGLIFSRCAEPVVVVSCNVVPDRGPSNASPPNANLKLH